ncbi:MAG: DUF4837 family protein [Bacteroidetes bacterium]|nr:DUF4837 family protein [Bacteroidota bacterium]
MLHTQHQMNLNLPSIHQPTSTRPAVHRLIFSAILASMLFLTACESLEYRPPAVGREGDVVVVMDSARWNGPIGDAVRMHVSPYLGTLPAPEREFSLNQMTITSQSVLEGIQKQKNVIFVAPLSDESREAAFLRSRLDSTALSAIRGGQASVIPRRDLWRTEQQVIYVFGDTEESILRELEARGSDIRYQFNTITRERVQVDMFEKGRQFDIERAIEDKHDFSIRVQHDYFTSIDTTNFVWLRRVVDSNSWRSLFVYYIDNFDPTNLTPEWVYAARDRITETNVRGNADGFVLIDYRRELNTENIDFLGRFGYETRGLWHMVEENEQTGDLMEFGMGGPFVNYTFYDDESRRLYMIDGMVFAPGYDKREFLRHMEVIAHTFRNGTEVATARAASGEGVD